MRGIFRQGRRDGVNNSWRGGSIRIAADGKPLVYAPGFWRNGRICSLIINITEQNVTPFLSRFALFITLSFAFLGYTQASTLPPLSPAEMHAVIDEIKAMVKTDESQVTRFPVREATPARIEQLYSMPEFLQQPTIVRVNGIIFAGKGSLLQFDKPSDIVTKLSAWFPKEFAATRAKSDAQMTSSFRLYGPYPGWQEEPLAFLTLWNCMPQGAWLRPAQNPFARRFDDGIPFMAIADRSSGQYDFGACVRERSGRRPAWKESDIPIVQNEVRDMGNRVAPVLQRKFARFLSTNRCRGTGPDDCALILLLWSSLSPADPALAKAIQTLEPDVSPGGPLPALQKTANQYGDSEQDGEPHFDAGLRRAAFLRAKLVSVLHAENAWPSQALPATLHQITSLQNLFSATRNFRWSRYAIIGSRNAEVDPWYALSLDVGKTPRVKAAVLAEMESLARDPSCDVLQDWFKGGGTSLQAAFALRHLQDQPPLQCASPDWASLKQGQSAETRELRSKYLGLVGQVESGTLHEMLLTLFTDYGNSCFDKQGKPSQDWLRAVCKAWVAEPQTVPATLQHSRLTLNDESKFHSTTVQLPAATANKQPDTTAWLTQLVQGMNGEARQKMQAFVAGLKRRDVSISAATRWDHPRYDKSLIELDLSKSDLPTDEPGWPYRGPRILLVVEPQTIAFADVPERFGGSNVNAEIVNVSDLDQDGNLEVWWAESFRTCHGDETDLERDLDCSGKMADMGEIWGNSLSYFANTPGISKPSAMRKPLPATASLTAADMSMKILEDQRRCNTVLIGTVLEKPLGIRFRKRVNDGDVIDLVCKTHPLHPEQTIVALFHDLNDQQDSHAGEEKKGFVLAVLDINRRRLLSLYRDTIGEDATTRIDEFALQIDTGRYNLAPGIRALGVRMNIGYSPKCAEGGESNYLSLFVEEGTQLKPVLKDLPMSIWTITEGSNGCGSGDAAYTMDSVELTLAIAPALTNGWHDLEVVAHHLFETGSGAAETSAKQPPKTQVVDTLRASGKMYSGERIRGRIWPGQ